MHHSQPFVGGDDYAKPSVFKMISPPSCFAIQSLTILVMKTDTRYQPGSVLPPTAAKTDRVHSARQNHGGIAICAGGTGTPWGREPGILGGA
jgi:hypothetical protein